MPRKTDPLLDSSGTLSARALSPREILAGYLADTKPAYQTILGLLGESQGQTAEDQFRDAINPVGNVLMAYDAGRDIGEGHYLAGLTALGAAALPIPGKKGIRAFHGSPHSFEKFSLDKIGTGEGAQAFGHGLYFAENEGVAKNYRNVLSDGTEISFKGQPVTKDNLGEIDDPDLQQRLAKSLAWGQGKTLDEEMSELQQLIQARSRDGAGAEPRWGVDPVQFDEWRRELSALERHKADLSFRPGGHMYEVEIGADPETFLDWDKPLSKQPEAIRQLAAQPNEHGRSVSDWLDAEGVKNPTGGDFYKQLNPGDQAGATQQMQRAGVPGIKYLDQGSRGAGAGTHNYVVFDESTINIVRKYGIAAALAAGAISQSDALDLQAQGYD